MAQRPRGLAVDSASLLLDDSFSGEVVSLGSFWSTVPSGLTLAGDSEGVVSLSVGRPMTSHKLLVEPDDGLLPLLFTSDPHSGQAMLSSDEVRSSTENE